MATIAKRDIKAAERLINEQLDLIAEIRTAEGSREANASASWPDTQRRMRGYISTLLRANAPIPARLSANWSHYRAMGWHSELTAPRAEVLAAELVLAMSETPLA